MKNLLLLLICALTFSQFHAQQILEISISPTNPDDDDEILVIIRSQFSSGGCDGMLNYYVVGDTVFSTGMHCPGMLTVICESIDTLVLPPLQAGNYTVNHTLMQGVGDPCDAFSTVDQKNFDFTVIPTTAGVEDKTLEGMKLFPNPANDFFRIASKETADIVQVEIYNLSGQAVVKQELHLKDFVAVSDLESGMYIVMLTDSKGDLYRLRFEKD